MTIASMAALWGVVLSGNLIPDLRTPVNVIDPDVDGTPVSVNGLFIDGTLMNVNDPDVDRNQTGWTPPYNNFSHYQTSLLNCLGPFSVACPLLPTLYLSLVYVIAQVLHPSRQVARALKLLISSDGFSMIRPQGQTALPLVHGPYLRDFCASILARWIPKKIPSNHFQCNCPNVFQTFSRA